MAANIMYSSNSNATYININRHIFVLVELFQVKGNTFLSSSGLSVWAKAGVAASYILNNNVFV